MSKQKILLVDSDAKSQRVLEVSLKKAGFEVSAATNVEDALIAALAGPPDVVVTEAEFPVGTGFDLCRRLRDDPRTSGVAVVFLAHDGSPEAKIRAISAGADEYLTKPTFVKEIITRVGGLLDRRQKEALSRKDRPATFRGTLGAMGLVDLFQLVESGRKSGVLHLRSDPARSGGLVANPTEASIWFRDGRAVDAEVGRLRGETAVYRLLLWDDADFELDFSPTTRDIAIHTAPQGLLLEGMRRVDEWARLAPRVPPLHARLEVDYRALSSGLSGMPREAEEVVRLFDGHRKLLDALDDASIDELSALGIVARLIEDGVLVHATSSRATQPAPSLTLEAWLSQTREPAGAADVDAADILANLPSELGGAMYPSAESASQILAAANIPLTEPPAPGPRETVRPEPLVEVSSVSAILSRSTIPASSTSMPPARSAPTQAAPDARPADGRLVVRRLSSVVATIPEPLEPALVSPRVSQPTPPAAEPAPTRPASAPPPPPAASGPVRPSEPAPVAEIPMMVRPAGAPEPDDDPGAPSGRPRRSARGATFRAARRPLAATPRPSQPAPEPAEEAATAPPAPRAPTPAPRAPSPPPRAPTPPPPPRAPSPLPRAVTPVPTAPPRAATPRPAAPSRGRDLDDDFAYLRQVDEPPRNTRVQAFLAVAVVGVLVGAVAWLTSDRKQPRVSSQLPQASAVAPTRKQSGWPAEGAAGMTITTIAPTTSIAAAGTASTATIAAAPAPAPTPAIDRKAVDAEVEAGFAALKKQRFRDAQKSYAKALELDPKNAAAQAGLGHALAQLGRYAEATAAAKSALEYSGDKLGHGFYVLGLVALDANRMKEASDNFRKFLERDPSSPFAADVRPLVKP